MKIEKSSIVLVKENVFFDETGIVHKIDPSYSEKLIRERAKHPETLIHSSIPDMLKQKNLTPDWKEMLGTQADLRWQIEKSRELVAQRDQWETKFAELKKHLPVYPADKKMDVHWLSNMDDLARARNLRIPKRKAGKEKQHGQLFEFPIECDWEGSLEAITYFLFDLQKKGGMLDVRQLLIRPKHKQLLSGRFSLYCAYSRAEDDSKK